MTTNLAGIAQLDRATDFIGRLGVRFPLPAPCESASYTAKKMKEQTRKVTLLSAQRGKVTSCLKSAVSPGLLARVSEHAIAPTKSVSVGSGCSLEAGNFKERTNHVCRQ